MYGTNLAIRLPEHSRATASQCLEWTWAPTTNSRSTKSAKLLSWACRTTQVLIDRGLRSEQPTVTATLCRATVLHSLHVYKHFYTPFEPGKFTKPTAGNMNLEPVISHLFSVFMIANDRSRIMIGLERQRLMKLRALPIGGSGRTGLSNLLATEPPRLLSLHFSGQETLLK